MRSRVLFGLLGLAASCPLCLGDYVVVGQRAGNFATINSQSYDRVWLSVYNDGANGTAPSSVGFPSVDALEVALFAPLHGMLISLNAATHQPDVFGAGPQASLATASYINGNTWSGFTDAPAPQILNGSGSSYAVDQANLGGMFGGTYTDLQAVAGISGDFYTQSSSSWPNIGPTAAAAKIFAQVVVAHGDPVFVLPPTAAPYSRVFPSTQFEPTGTSFGVPTVQSGVVAANNTPGVLPGDADLDGIVAFADFAKVVADYSKPGGWTEGDFNGNGTVDFNDFAITVANYNKASSFAGSWAVPAPEPAGIAVIALAALLLGRRRTSAGGGIVIRRSEFDLRH
jgi:hypothetical protein